MKIKNPIIYERLGKNDIWNRQNWYELPQERIQWFQIVKVNLCSTQHRQFVMKKYHRDIETEHWTLQTLKHNTNLHKPAETRLQLTPFKLASNSTTDSARNTTQNCEWTAYEMEYKMMFKTHQSRSTNLKFNWLSAVCKSAQLTD